MSQNYEESPESDSKMDISESATSHESVSPVAENLQEECLSGTVTPTNNIIKQRAESPLLKLDNDLVTQLRPQQNSNMLRSELTVAPYHPLMSPPGTDSDSENGYNRVFSFPDVIPKSEQPLLLLANPASILNNSNSIEITNSHNKKVSPNIFNVDAVKNLNSTKLNNGDDEFLDENQVPGQRKIPFLRPPSPDLISSESEQELSQYQATVEPVTQSVALISNNLIRNNGNIGAKNTSPLLKPLQRRKIPISSEIVCDDISSLDSISNHSFDDDVEPNLASISPSSSFMDDDFGDEHDEFDDDFCDITPTNVPSDPIPTYAADDERRDSRNWQKITLPDGRTREIDMRVIEPYKRVLSHGGYLKAGGHNAIVIFCACHLPDRSRADYHYVMDNLFLYVVKTLEQLVTEDYVLVYLHGGSSRRNVPPFPWLKKCYQLLDRRLRKSLRNLYLVHPTFWLKSVVWMSRPFVSSKFWRKLVYVRTLEELYSLVSVEKTSIPEKVKNYDSKFK